MSRLVAFWHRVGLRHRWVWAAYHRRADGTRTRIRTCSCGEQREAPA